MNRILAALAMSLLATTSSLAQSRCNEVRQGVADFGYSMVRQYSLEHYGAGGVRYVDRCLMNPRTETRTRHRRHVHHH
jgi:hypothetical protein